MRSVTVTYVANEFFAHFREGLTDTGQKLMSDCAKELVAKLQNRGHVDAPSPSVPGKYVVNARGVLFAWYTVKAPDVVTIERIMLRGNVPASDRKLSGQD